jgi:hypothetical protein
MDAIVLSRDLKKGYISLFDAAVYAVWIDFRSLQTLAINHTCKMDNNDSVDMQAPPISLLQYAVSSQEQHVPQALEQEQDRTMQIPNEPKKSPSRPWDDIERQVQDLRQDIDHAWDESLRFLQHLERSSGEQVTVWRAWQECERSSLPIAVSDTSPSLLQLQDELSTPMAIAQVNRPPTPRWSFDDFVNLDVDDKHESIMQDMSSQEDKIKSVLNRLRRGRTSAVMSYEQDGTDITCHSI